MAWVQARPTRRSPETPANLVAASFGSYGWSGEAVKMMNEIIKELDVVLCHPGVKVQYVPGHEQLG